MTRTDKAISATFGVPELATFSMADEEPDTVPAVIDQSTGEIINATPSGELVVLDPSAQIDADTQFVKDTLKNLLEQGQDALANLIEIAKAEERASHFEALGGMINQLSGVAMSILEAEKKKQALKIGLGEEPAAGGQNIGTQNNIVFTGTTTELQALLAKTGGDVIDVDANEIDEEDE